jgi:D-lactate dehydrogenase (cytochrome)
VHRPAPPAGVCVLISRLAECIHLTNQDIAQVSVPIARFDHVGNGTLTVMRAIKAALDPDNSLNPSKILPLA